MIRRNRRPGLLLATAACLLLAVPTARAQESGPNDGGQQREGRGRGGRGDWGGGRGEGFGGRGRNRGQDGENGQRGGRGVQGEGGRGERRRTEGQEPTTPATPPAASTPTPSAATPSASAPATRGFGSVAAAGRTSGFGGNSPASLPPSGAVAAGAASNAESMFTRYDRNRDGKLDAGEMARSRFLDLKPADRSGDGSVTKDELTAWMAARAQGGAAATAATSAKPAAPPPPSGVPAAPPSSSVASTRPAASSSASATAADSEPAGPHRKSYRFLSATERLPSGLPSWFREKDRDRDGQVLMSEWTSRWSDAAVSEFSGHDRNGDGVITPAEALRSGG